MHSCTTTKKIHSQQEILKKDKLVWFLLYFMLRYNIT